MGKNLVMKRFREVTQLTVDGDDHPFQGDPFFSIIKRNGEIVGFEIVDIEYIDAEDIPEVEDIYDLDELGIRDCTIRELVLLLRDRLSDPIGQKHRKTA